MKSTAWYSRVLWGSLQHMKLLRLVYVSLLGWLLFFTLVRERSPCKPFYSDSHPLSPSSVSHHEEVNISKYGEKMRKVVLRAISIQFAFRRECVIWRATVTQRCWFCGAYLSWGNNNNDDDCSRTVHDWFVFASDLRWVTECLLARQHRQRHTAAWEFATTDLAARWMEPSFEPQQKRKSSKSSGILNTKQIKIGHSD